MTTIPASYIVQVMPGVVNAGGDALDLNALVLSHNTRIPIGTVMSFPTAAAVSAFFGPTARDSLIAGGGTDPDTGNPLGSGYFGGYTNGFKTPGALLFTQYNLAAVAAYLWGGNISGVSIATLQALTGSLTVVMDGYTHVISSISLASYSSYSAMAAAIQAAFTDPTEASFTASIGSTFTGTGAGTNLTVASIVGYLSPGDSITGTGVPANTKIVSQTSGTTGSNGVYVTNNSTTVSGAVVATSTVLDVTVCASPTIAIGQTVVGAGVTGTPVITAQLTGTAGGVGTYQLSGTAQGVASEAMTGVATAPLVTYDSVSGAFVITSGITGAPSTSAFATGSLAASLLLTQATGAYLSQGAAIPASQAAFMNNIVNNITQNWATFMTAFDPDAGSGNTQKLAFANWVNTTGKRYAYVCADTDVSPTVSVPASSSLGYLLQQSNADGTCLVWEPSDFNLPAFICGFAASLDFARTNGRTTLAFRNQAGLVANVSNETIAVNLGGNPQSQSSYGNGYNFYGAIATANQQFVNMQRGTISGEFQWFDSYINQIWLNNQFQLALVELLQNSPSIPYNSQGYSQIEAALQDPINAGLNFGAFRAGVTLSAVQINEVNNAAGANIAPTLQARGWYLQIVPATAQIRQGRSSPEMTFWYTDGESVQSFNLASILVQ